MCSVIGAVMVSPKRETFDTLLRVFHESRIRGLHATGISYVKNGSVHTEKLPVPSTEFPFDFPNYVNEDGNLYLIGHCRYSTSDLLYNQPISNDRISIAHNGVISQELPENWEKLYGYHCETKNDSELLLKSIEDERSPLHHWTDASLAVCELYSNKKLRFYRNGKRPIYFTSMENGYIITSTQDISKRAGLSNSPTECKMNIYHHLEPGLDMFMSEVVSQDNKDLQEVNHEKLSA